MFFYTQYRCMTTSLNDTCVSISLVRDLVAVDRCRSSRVPDRGLPSPFPPARHPLAGPCAQPACLLSAPLFAARSCRRVQCAVGASLTMALAPSLCLFCCGGRARVVGWVSCKRSSLLLAQAASDQKCRCPCSLPLRQDCPASARAMPAHAVPYHAPLAGHTDAHSFCSATRPDSRSPALVTCSGLYRLVDLTPCWGTCETLSSCHSPIFHCPHVQHFVHP